MTEIASFSKNRPVESVSLASGGIAVTSRLDEPRSSAPAGEGIRDNSRTGSIGVHDGRTTYQTASDDSTGRRNRTGTFRYGALG